MGSRLLGEMLSSVSTRELPADERRYQEKRYRRTRSLHTVLGPIEFERDYYRCPECTRIPFDEEVGILDESFSPGVRKMMGFAASQGSYIQASEELRMLARLEISDHSIQREVQKTGPKIQKFMDALPQEPIEEAIPVMYVLTDGTGAPMRKDALEGRKGKQADGSSKTREVKVGCVYTQHTCDEKGAPITDKGSVSHIANFKTAQDFGGDVLHEARRRGLAHATQKVFLGDGAKWIWEIARVNFPDAVQILDYYHASEHLTLLYKHLFGDVENKNSPYEKWKTWLWEGEVNLVLAEVSKFESKAKNIESLEKEKKYFLKNAKRMKYGTYRKSGWEIGSGKVEAGCRTVVAERMKKSGMFWSLPGAENILAFRCCVMNHSYDAFWDEIMAA